MNRIGVEPSDLESAAQGVDLAAQALLALRRQLLAVGTPDPGRADTRSELSVTVERLLRDLALSGQVVAGHADDLRAAGAAYAAVEASAVRPG